MSTQFTLTYAVVDGLDIKLDLYAPAVELQARQVPGILFFHGGRLVCGARDDIFLPNWLKGTFQSGFSQSTYTMAKTICQMLHFNGGGCSYQRITGF
jgi:hypothetical protein